MKRASIIRIILTIAIIIIALGFEIAIPFILKDTFADSSILEALYYSSQIISSFFVISGVVIAVWQYYLSSKNIKTNLELEQVQRAIDLSAYYKDDIIKYIPVIKYVFEKAGINNILNAVNPELMKEFNYDELTRIFTKTQIEELKKIQHSECFTQAVFEANDIYNLGLKNFETEVKTSDKTENTPTNESDKTTTVSAKSDDSTNEQQRIAGMYMANLLCTLLNNMEFFALHFRHKTATESVVYQSLHQTYCDMIPTLYYYIANGNTSETSRYYTNVIWLYEEWKKAKTKQRENSRNLEIHGPVIKN